MIRFATTKTPIIPPKLLSPYSSDIFLQSPNDGCHCWSTSQHCSGRDLNPSLVVYFSPPLPAAPIRHELLNGFRMVLIFLCNLSLFLSRCEVLIGIHVLTFSIWIPSSKVRCMPLSTLLELVPQPLSRICTLRSLNNEWKWIDKITTEIQSCLCFRAPCFKLFGRSEGSNHLIFLNTLSWRLVHSVNQWLQALQLVKWLYHMIRSRAPLLHFALWNAYLPEHDVSTLIRSSTGL